MPSFVDLYIPRIKQDGISIRDALLGSFTGSEKVEVLKDLFSQTGFWNDLPKESQKFTDIVGCDGSYFAFTMRNGGKIGIVRSLAKGKYEEERLLDIGVIQGKDHEEFLVPINTRFPFKLSPLSAITKAGFSLSTVYDINEVVPG